MGSNPVIFDVSGQFESSLGDECGEIIMIATGETEALQFDPFAEELTIETDNNSLGGNATPYKVYIGAYLNDYPTITATESITVSVDINSLVID